jgi:hypothetical protein
MPNKKIPYNPKYWRDRAEEMRHVAALMTDPDAKQKMLGVVESYKKFARQAEQVLEGETKTPV